MDKNSGIGKQSSGNVSVENNLHSIMCCNISSIIGHVVFFCLRKRQSLTGKLLFSKKGKGFGIGTARN